MVVDFRLYSTDEKNLQLRVTGDIEPLGLWQPEKSLILAPENQSGSVRSGVMNWHGADAFQYKYVITDSAGRALQWEQCSNRIAKLDLVEPLDNGTQELFNAWDAVLVQLRLYHPLEEGSVMAVRGSCTALGNWGNPRFMELGPVRTLLTGARGRCWETFFPFEGGELSYRYGEINRAASSAKWARDPINRCSIPPLHEVLNGSVLRLDSNFVSEMEITEVPGYGLWLGPYPQSRDDIEVLHKAGVTAVVSLQTDADHKHLFLDWQDLADYYLLPRVGITCLREPIQDFSHDELRRLLPKAAALINELRRQGHVIYVHCTAGMGRSPAAVIMYLVRYCGFELEPACDFVRRFRNVACPNEKAIAEALADCAGFGPTAESSPFPKS